MRLLSRIDSRSLALSVSSAPTFALSFALPLTTPLVAATALVGTASTFAAAPAPLPQSGPYWAKVTGDDVLVRSGPSIQSAYAIGRLPKGQAVKVIAVEYGWAKVAATGSAFQSTIVYIKKDTNSSYDEASKRLTVTGEAGLIAANMDVGYAPEKSWRNIGTAKSGETFAVTDVKQVGPDTFYSVPIPASAEVWVYNQFLQTLTQAEADALEQGRATTPTVPAPTPKPTPPAGPTANPPSGAGAPPASGTGPAPAPPVPGTVTNNVPAAPTGTAGAEGTTPPAVDPEAARRAEEAKAKAEADRKAREAAEEAARQRKVELQLRQVTYNDLESKWRRVREEPAEAAELDALRERYLALADDSVAAATTRQLAAHRADQIALRIEVQNSLLEIASRKEERNKKIEAIAELDLAQKKRMPYDAMGRLNASTVYDGDRLPLLYKLADPSTGHTIAYVIPGPNSKPSEALGLLVGLKGVRRYDETLRVNVIVPDSIDVLETTTSASTAKPAPKE